MITPLESLDIARITSIKGETASAKPTTTREREDKLKCTH